MYAHNHVATQENVSLLEEEDSYLIDLLEY